MSSIRNSRFTHPDDAPPIRVSFEFFPPKTADMETTLWEAIARLAPLQPNFVSVTYGAGGSTRERTHATVKRIIAETMLTPAAHLTCVAASRDDLEVAFQLWPVGERLDIAFGEIGNEDIAAACLRLDVAIQDNRLQLRHVVRAERQRAREAHLDAGPAVVVVARGHHRDAFDVEFELGEVSHR